ncbi:MAG: hypothetical protein OEY16_04825 [Alphaproteobacteria bacterium]|nr:hypothetical protein [Alphaproteobacteria bacterium]
MQEIDIVCRTPPGQAAVSLRGASGMLHGFTAFPLSEAPCGPAVYIFARPVADLHCRIAPGWTFLSIGETGGIRDRIDARYARIVEGHMLGATHILIHFCYRDAGQRRMILDDLAAPLRLARRQERIPPRAA